MLICMLSIKLFTFSAIISLNILCSFFLFSPSETPMMPMLICLMKPHRSEALFNFLSLFSFCSSDYIISIVLSSNFLILSSGCSNLPFNHIVNFSFWSLYSSAPEIFVHIFLGFPSLYWYSILFTHCLFFILSTSYFSSLSIFKRVALKDLSRRCAVGLFQGQSTDSIVYFGWTVFSSFYAFFDHRTFELNNVITREIRFFWKSLPQCFAVFHFWFCLLFWVFVAVIVGCLCAKEKPKV